MKNFVSNFVLIIILSCFSINGSVNVSGPSSIDFEIKVNEAHARGGRGGRGGGRMAGHRSSRSSMRSSSHRSSARAGSRQTRPSVNRPSPAPKKNTNINKNINVNKNVNVDVDRRRRGGVVAGAIVAGAIITSLPARCNSIYVDSIRYHDCSGSYYTETYQGTDVVYQSVGDPN